MEVTTVEDAWAVRLMDMLTGLHQLQVEGMTREMYIWGNVQVWQRSSKVLMPVGYCVFTNFHFAGTMGTWHH